jgi:nicotinate-nucleotide adenylyltransferase
MQIGIFGGTFDPVHWGHLLLAESCREQGKLDEVWFVPAAVSPWKTETPPAEAKHRLQMLELALGGHAQFHLCSYEIDKGGVSYTVDTLRWIKQQRPHDTLRLLMGADAVADLPQWREPAAICALALPLVVQRPEAPALDLTRLEPLLTPEQRAQVQAHQVSMPAVQLSSSEIRRRLAAGESIRYLVPRGVEMYIATHGLYGSAGGSSRTG